MATSARKPGARTAPDTRKRPRVRLFAPLAPARAPPAARKSPAAAETPPAKPAAPPVAAARSRGSAHPPRQGTAFGQGNPDCRGRLSRFAVEKCATPRGDQIPGHLLELKKEFPDMQMVLHSDQGSVYASKDFNELLPMYNVVRSMSRAGTPTDNAAMEAINGWIKAELFMDFHVTGNASVEQEVDDYIVFFNEQRPAYSLSYLTPKQFREQFAPYHNC